VSDTCSTSDLELPWVTEVLRFWFEELGERDWFATRGVIDEQIRNCFLDLHESLAGRHSSADELSLLQDPEEWF
jgi:uncharacterized protein (DUF924 family)